MPRQVLVVSGPVSSGKSTLCDSLADRFNVVHFKTRQLLLALYPEVAAERKAMQELGDQLDKRTRGGWVRDGLDRKIRDEHLPDDAIVVVDAVRIPGQVHALRKAYGSARVTHIHLHAPNKELARRYANRPHEGVRELPSYREVTKNITESKVPLLETIADIVIDTHRCTKKDVMVKTASRLGLYGRECVRLVDVIVGGQYGSEGKGHIASHLAPEYDVLVRVGGPNAGHTVFSDKPFTFHHLPSGSMKAPNAHLVIGPGATIYVPELIREVGELGISCERLSVDPQTMVISDADRRSEIDLVHGIGSTGRGVGAAAARRIRHRLPGKVKLAKDQRVLRPFLREACERFEDAFRVGRRVLLEGTQGACLSLYHGSYPFVTSRDTTVAGCLAEAGISASRTRKVIMVCRSYPIRVQSPSDGSSGEMAREIRWGEVEWRSGLPRGSLSKKELTSTTKRERRVGEFEWDGLRKAASLNAPTDVALTFLDYIDKRNKKARRFEQLTPESIRFVEEVECVAAAPVSIISTRFDYRSIIDRRAW